MSKQRPSRAGRARRSDSPTTQTARLKTEAESSTPTQRSRLVVVAKHKGVSLDELRTMVGGSVRALSSARCSEWIKNFSGEDLPNPPGQKPGAYKGRPEPGVTRMISDDQCEQIMRLAREYFDDDEQAARAWLLKYCHVHEPRELLTAAKGNEVIYTLKGMVNRKRKSG